MLRGCSFTFAGVDSRDFNLELYYVDTSYNRATTGGNFELISDKIPYFPETILYGLDYSANPLQFDIEILNPYETISQNEFCEIKEWLFGQDGWKPFTVEDEDYDGLYLNCLLTPDEDIIDASGYRGLKCTLTNISSFWYGDDKNIVLNKTDGSNTTINIQSHNPEKIYPIIEFDVPSGTRKISISNVSNGETSMFEIDRTNTSKYPFAISSGTYVFDTKYCTLKRNNSIVSMDGLKTDVDLLYLLKGENTITVTGVNGASNPIVTYTPTYRVGGF